jgi:competence protein ComEC
MSPRWNTDFRIYWIQYPFVRLLIPFVTGLLTADVCYLPLMFSLPILSFLLIVCIVLHVASRSNRAWRLGFGICYLFFFFIFGYLWQFIQNEAHRPGHFNTDISRAKKSLICKIEYVEEKDRFYDAYSEVLAIVDSTGTLPTAGNLLVRFPKSIARPPHTRDIIFFRQYILRPDGASAPFEFDWAQLLHRRNIHALTYIDTNSYALLQAGKASFIDRVRDWSDQLLLDVFGAGRDYPVASAILLGLRKKIDPELYKAYSATGAVHILAVSGLHVGIIAQLFEWIFQFLFRRQVRYKWIQSVAILVIIWLYTILTGATPSIMRSAFMFSAFIIGRGLQREAVPMNILAGTAFFLLLWNPRDLYNIGFQLSFGAMAGIFLFYETIRTLVTIRTIWLQWVWKVFAVSIAAQLIIYPVVGYYFHQFAFYFWLTSLIATPLSYIILFLGIFIFPIIALKVSILTWIQYPLIWAVMGMNNLIAWIYTLPLGKVGGWWPTQIDTILLILASIVICHWLKRKSVVTLQVALGLLILIFSVLAYENFSDGYKSELIISRQRNQIFSWVKWGRTLIRLDEHREFPCLNYLEAYRLDSADMIHLRPDQAFQDEFAYITQNEINTSINRYFIFDKDPPRSYVIDSTVIPKHLIILRKEFLSDTLPTQHVIYTFKKFIEPTNPAPVKNIKRFDPYMQIPL